MLSCSRPLCNTREFECLHRSSSHSFVPRKKKKKKKKSKDRDKDQGDGDFTIDKLIFAAAQT